MIQKLSKIFGTCTKAQEILLLQNNLKEVVRQGYYEDELRLVEDYCKKNDLFLVKSKFHVILEEDGYSNKGTRVFELEKDKEQKAMRFVYISKDEKSAYLASYYELIRDDKNFGKVLGYPDCCISFFMNNFSKDNPNPVQEPTNIYTNITKRDIDIVLISHFPCTSECTESINIAKKNLELIEKYDKKRAKKIIEELSER